MTAADAAPVPDTYVARPAMLVPDASEVWALQQDESWLYWSAARTSQNESDGLVGRVSKKSTAIDIVAPGQSAPYRMVFVGDDLYFADSRGVIARVPRSGGQVEEVVTDVFSATGLATDGESLFWTRTSPDGVYKTSLAKPSADLLYDESSNTFDVVVDDTYVYWDNTTAIMRMPKDGSAEPQPLVEDEQNPGYPVLDGNYLYWRSTRGDSLHRVKTDGSGRETIVSGVVTLVGPALDETYVYWAENHIYTILGEPDPMDSEIYRRPKQGGPVELVVSGIGDVLTMVVDDTTIYFAVGNSIWALDKPPE